MIQESHHFTKRFNMHVKRVSESPVDANNIRNLRFAAQRYESCHRPRARFVLFMGDAIATACDIVAIRKGQVEADEALAFLTWLDNEKLITLGMMTDYGDPTLQLIRFSTTPTMA